MNVKTVLSVGLALIFLSYFSFFNFKKDHDHDHSGHDHHDHDHHDSSEKTPKADKHAHHHHEAPHGGTLVVLGDEFAHLEFLLYAQTGLLQVYALDGMAIMGTRLQQPDINLNITTTEKSFDLKLTAQSNPLTGEKIGDSSLYSIISQDLIGLTQFKVKLDQIVIKGIAFKDVLFDFPEGNE
jgi:hypothetical protein